MSPTSPFPHSWLFDTLAFCRQSDSCVWGLPQTGPRNKRKEFPWSLLIWENDLSRWQICDGNERNEKEFSQKNSRNDMDGVKLYRRQWYPIKSMYLVPNYIGVNTEISSFFRSREWLRAGLLQEHLFLIDVASAAFSTPNTISQYVTYVPVPTMISDSDWLKQGSLKSNRCASSWKMERLERASPIGSITGCAIWR